MFDIRIRNGVRMHALYLGAAMALLCWVRPCTNLHIFMRNRYVHVRIYTMNATCLSGGRLSLGLSLLLLLNVLTESSQLLYVCLLLVRLHKSHHRLFEEREKHYQ